jgi:2'-hydroxyisoflavone reductase
MRLLVLGGTVFLGRAVAAAARDAGHVVTCAARGSSGQPVPGVTFVAVDRDRPDGLAALDRLDFDAVVDVARKPSHARRAVAALAGRVEHATYVSSCSVYSDTSTPGQVVDGSPTLAPAPLEMDDPSLGPDEYGRCKVACEQAYLDGFGADRVFINRAGLIVGPEDPTGRFTYWVHRVARGGEILAPGEPHDQVQFVDVRDLAEWIVSAAQRRLAGVFDGTSAPITRERMLMEISAGLGVPLERVTWLPADVLARHGVQAWSGPKSLPVWVPLPQYAGFLSRDVRGSLADGLRIRPLTETALDLYRWLMTSENGLELPTDNAGLSAVQEAEVLRAAAH